MSTCIAILIGVEQYSNEARLPACQADVDLIADIVKSSGKYADCLVMGASPTSADAKDRLAQFIRNHAAKEIDELFFYYSGHGSRYADDFVYMFADFSSTRRETTGLRNTELDDMLRSLNPKLVVKVVDACQAGTEYIKNDMDAYGELRKATVSAFAKVYFLLSSSQLQSSVALSDFSVFTKSFADAVAYHKGKQVRFRDIMDYISDDAQVQKYQTPLFIQQATNTEIFCSVTDEVVAAIASRFAPSSFVPATGAKELASVPVAPRSFGARVVEAARMKSAVYCSQEEAQASLERFVCEMERYVWGSPMSDLYSATTSRRGDVDDFPGISTIGEWLKKASGEYFAEVGYRDEQYDARERVEVESANPLSFTSSILAGFGGKYEYRTVRRTRKVVAGLSQTAESPCSALNITMRPTEMALPSFQIFVPFVFSKWELVAFLRCERERDLSWSNRTICGTGKWQTFPCRLKDLEAVESMAKAILKRASEEILLDAARAVDVAPEADVTKA